jgi:hypothetical protein
MFGHGEVTQMVRASGWPDGANLLFFITIVREFTGISLAEAKDHLDWLRGGEDVLLATPGTVQSAALVAKLLRYAVVHHTVVEPAEPGAAADRGLSSDS